MKEKSENFLDYIPKHNSLMQYSINENGYVEIAVINRGLFNRLAQVFFKRPRVSHIELEDMGSFIWKQIDGNRSVYEIGILVREEFGDKAEPLYERLCTYIKTLHNNEYIVYQNKK